MNIDPHQPRLPKKHLTGEQRLGVVIQYLILTAGGERRARSGAMEALEQRAGVSQQHIRLLYHDCLSQIEGGAVFPDLSPMKDLPRGPDSELDENLA